MKGPSQPPDQLAFYKVIGCVQDDIMNMGKRPETCCTITARPSGVVRTTF